MTTTTFGVDLITFYSPAFWGLPNGNELAAAAEKDPQWFWSRLLGAVEDAGVTTLELTFPPGHWRSAIRAFGSATGFKAELRARNMSLVSGFYAGVANSAGGPVADHSRLIADAAEYAQFIAEAGAGLMVVGLPMRQTRGGTPAVFNNLEYAQRLCDVIHDVAAATLLEGVRVALHTETHSVFCTRRDVDLYMTLTDPMYVWFCPDTGHLALAGTDPVAAASYHRDRIAIAHWKDATGSMPLDVTIDCTIHDRHHRYFTRTGAGMVDWPAWARLMRDLHFDKVTMLEIDTVDDPVAAISAAREYITTALAPIYAPAQT